MTLLKRLLLLFVIARARSLTLLRPDCAQKLSGGLVHRERSFLPASLVTALRQELHTLSFAPTASFSSNGEEDDLRSALTCRPDVNSDAFDLLYGRLLSVRTELEQMEGCPELSSGIEATYVIYPTGGYYQRHIDSLQGVDEHGSGRRAVSFIVYLTDPEREWTASDGGALRVYGG